MKETSVFRPYLVLLAYFIFSFPLFYFVYKFGYLLEGYDDARHYLDLFKNLRDPDVPSPFNMRLLGASVVHVMEKTGLFYSTQCSVDMDVIVNKRFFFNNVLFNYICVNLTAYSIYRVFIKLNFTRQVSFVSGLVFFLGFGTIFYLMMPGVDSLSVLLFTWTMYFYLRKSKMIFLIFFLLIFQREYFFLVYMVVALFDYFRLGKNRYYLIVLGGSVMAFGLYYFLRKTIFHTDHWNHQTSPTFLLSSLTENRVPVLPMIRQTLMTMNLYFLYLFLLLYKKMNGKKINTHQLITSLLILLQITILSFAATFGNNNGRYYYLIVPLIIYYAAVEYQNLNDPGEPVRHED